MLLHKDTRTPQLKKALWDLCRMLADRITKLVVANVAC